MGNVCVKDDLWAMYVCAKTICGQCVCEGRSVGNVCVKDDLWAMYV